MTLDMHTLETRLRQEEMAGPVTNQAELLERHRSRKELGDALHCLQQTVTTLTSRYRRLARLPGLEQVARANALLRLPNLLFCVIDTTGLHPDSDVLRVVLLNREGTVVFDRIVCPQRQPSQANTFYTGIAREQVLAAAKLSAIWEDLQRALEGHYVLAYNWEFVVERLRENATHYDLDPLHFLGECLMSRAATYYGTSGTLKLVDLCGRIGHALPPCPTAPERALGQLALLHAMAEGRTVAPAMYAAEDEALDDLDDEHPF
jgi:DNA polymerase III epsilon subunit-like protein